MKKTALILIILFLTGCAGLRLALVPSEIKEYCRRISRTAEGTSQNMQICIQQERTAKKQLSKMNIPLDIERNCRKLSESTGGSYQVIVTCINSELSDL